MSIDASKVHPMARFVALVPIAGLLVLVIAVMNGYRLESRRSMVTEWRTHAVAENGFSVITPDVFVINRLMMDIGSVDAPAQTYTASDRSADFNIAVIQRSSRDNRPPEQVAKGMGVDSTAAQSPSGLTMFRHDITEEGERTQAFMIFHGRTLYQLTVTSPADAFPAANAERFFNSFRILGKT